METARMEASAEDGGAYAIEKITCDSDTATT